ncbi:zinc-ribbon domain-containing protein [Streptomyces sp. NPDC059832]|uniref:zinc-ribbon domain-containing protein n=1 Tax=Streptomyces sp. NPDC059832 TaxID=3346966 RepID=UPI0036554B5E
MSIATQWHPDRNTGLDLARVGPGSRKAAFSQCDDGHVWQAQVHSRVAGGGGPPRRGGGVARAEHVPPILALAGGPTDLKHI